MKIFSERLKQTMKERNITQTQLAKILGLSQSVISCYCSGKKEPCLESLASICKALNETSDYLLGLSE